MGKKIDTVSATQIELFEKCNRLWYSKYILKEKQPDATDAMKDGLEVHQAIESLLKLGKVPTTGKWQKVIARVRQELERLDLVGHEREGVYSEKPIRVKTDGPWFTGAIDVLDSRPDVPVIYDIKSKNNLDYVLNEFQIEQNVQLAIYALWAMDKLDVSQIRIVHIYVLRDEERPEIKLVESVVSLESVKRVWHRVCGIVSRMMDVAELHPAPILRIDGNDNSCFAYGKPCWKLESTCDTKSPLVGLRKKEEKKEEDTPMEDIDLEEMRRRRAAREAAKAAVPNIVNGASAAMDAAFAAANATKSPLAGVDGYEPGQDCNGKGFYASKNGQGFVQVESGHTCAVCAPIMAPNSPSRTTPKPSPENQVSAPVEQVEPEKTKKEKGKKNEPKPPIDVIVEDLTEKLSDHCVYVGCTPIRLDKPLPLYADWVRPIEQEVARKHKVSHYSMIEYHALGIMSSAIKAALSTLPPDILLIGNEPTAGMFLSLLPSSVEVITRMGS